MSKVIYAGDFYMTGTLRFYSQGTIGVSTNSVKMKSRQNKYISLDCGSAYDTFSDIARNTFYTADYFAGDPVWVHPKARLSRDLIRKSGYTITRDKEKANYLIIPEPDYNQFSEISYHIVCMDGDTPYFFTVYDDYNRDVPEEKFEMAKERIRGWLSNDDVVFLCDDMGLKKACFFPSEEIYKQLIEEECDEIDDKVCIFDTKLKLTPNVDINVETLDVWARLDDINMLSRFVCASDWKEYPLTTKLFLEDNHYSIRYQTNNNIKMICRELGIGERVKPDMVVTAKDYNMLMAWAYHLMGKPVGATYITERDWENVPGSIKRLLKKRVAVTPVQIEQDEIFDNIINSAKN